MGAEDQTARAERTEQEGNTRGQQGGSARTPQGGFDQSNDESIADLVQQPIVKQWTKFVAALFALAGVGFGLVVILLDVVDQDVIDDVGLETAIDPMTTMTFFTAPYLAVVAAVIVGVFLGWYLDRDDKTTFLAAGISTLAGTVAFWVLAAILGSVPSDASLQFGGLLINSIVAGIAVGIVAAGGVWVVRNLSPAGVERTTRTAGSNVHATDD